MSDPFADSNPPTRPAGPDEATLARLEAARRLLDDHHVALDKQPLATDRQAVNQMAEVITTIRQLIDETGAGLTPHLRHLDTTPQRAITGGWTLYDEHRPDTWPPSHVALVIRQYHTEPTDSRNRYRDQRRGHYTAGRLWWRYRGERPLYGSVLDGSPCPHGWAYAWKVAD